MNKSIIMMAVISMIMAAQPSLASDDGHRMSGDMHENSMHSEHMQKGQMQGMQNQEQKKSGSMETMASMLLVKKEIDGFTVTFHAMKAREGMQHGGTHNFMAKVEKDGKALTDLTVNSKVKHPNGKTESKMLMKKGNWYMAGYDLGHEGQHQLMVLFKTTDGSKHFGGVFFPENESNQVSDVESQGADHEQHH